MASTSNAYHSTQAHILAVLSVTAVLVGLVSLSHYARLSATLLQPLQSALSFSTSNSTAHAHTPLHARPNLTIRCVLYDRPPRTGSTTVSNALATCLHKRGFRVNSFVRPDDRNASIARGLGLLATERDARSRDRRRDVAIVASHVWMTPEDVGLLRQHCAHIVYVTSAAAMWERVWSAAKMVSVKERNGNTRLDGRMLDNAAHWLAQSNRPYARFYDAYPWIRLTGPQRMREDGKHMEEIPHEYQPVRTDPPFHPDFVIRKDVLLADLGALLVALGCDRLRPRSTNVHKELDDADDAIAAVKSSVVEAVGHENGSVYAYLMDRTKYNDDGLARISAIMRSSSNA